MNFKRYYIAIVRISNVKGAIEQRNLSQDVSSAASRHSLLSLPSGLSTNCMLFDSLMSSSQGCYIYRNLEKIEFVTKAGKLNCSILSTRYIEKLSVYDVTLTGYHVSHKKSRKISRQLVLSF